MRWFSHRAAVAAVSVLSLATQSQVAVAESVNGNGMSAFIKGTSITSD